MWRTECFVLLTNLLLLIAYCTLLGLVCSSFMFPQDLDVAAYLRLNFGVLCLHMALAGIISQIPVDQVIDAMGEVGMKMDVSLRETRLGGVAVSPRGVEIAEKLGM